MALDYSAFIIVDIMVAFGGEALKDPGAELLMSGCGSRNIAWKEENWRECAISPTSSIYSRPNGNRPTKTT